MIISRDLHVLEASLKLNVCILFVLPGNMSTTKKQCTFPVTNACHFTLLLSFTEMLLSPLLPYLNFLPMPQRSPMNLTQPILTQYLDRLPSFPPAPFSAGPFCSQQLYLHQNFLSPSNWKKKTRSRQFSHWVGMTLLNGSGTSHHESTAPTGSCTWHLPHILIE